METSNSTWKQLRPCYHKCKSLLPSQNARADRKSNSRSAGIGNRVNAIPVTWCITHKTSWITYWTK